MITILQILQAYGDDDFFSVQELRSKFPDVSADDLKAVLMQADEQGVLSRLRANGAVEHWPRDERFFYEITPTGRHHVMTSSTGKAARSILDEIDGKGPKCAP